MKLLSNTWLASSVASASDLDVFTDEELGFALKSAALDMDRVVERWQIPGPLGLVRLARAAGGDGVFCALDLPLGGANKWFVEALITERPDGTPVDEPRRLLFDHLEMLIPNAGEASRSKNSEPGIASWLLFRLYAFLWKLPFVGKSAKVPLVNMPEKPLGAALRQLLAPCKSKRERIRGMLMSADVLDAIARAVQANASRLTVGLEKATSGHEQIGNIQFNVWMEGHKEAEAGALDTRTWYVSQGIPFEEFLRQFSTIHRSVTHTEAGEVAYITVQGVLRKDAQ